MKSRLLTEQQTETEKRVQECADARRAAILAAADTLVCEGQKYYVSAAGDDRAEGTSPATAWRTPRRVSEAELFPGDGVFFRRGDLFRGQVVTRPGVAYGAYGEGEKPRIYGGDRDLADPALWELYDPDHRIWRCREKMPDAGTLVFNGGAFHSVKLIPSYIGGRFVCREDPGRVFVPAEEMKRDLDLFCACTEPMTTVPSKGEDFPVPAVNPGSRGDLYLRCDRGNPGEVFDSVEILPRRNTFVIGDNANVRVDNLCLRYCGAHAIGGGGFVRGLHVTNCEIGWVGGTVQHYFGTDPNYPQGTRGTVTRFGNGIEIYGSCEDFVVRNCYLYQIYDAAITHQFTSDGTPCFMRHIRYEGNLVERCVYSIEYFLFRVGESGSCMEDVCISDNILRLCGCGWGQQRHNQDTPAHIKGWTEDNPARGFRVTGNIFDRSAYRMLHLVASEEDSLPVLEGNVYLQWQDGMLGQYGTLGTPLPMLPFDNDAETLIREKLGDGSARVCLLRR